MLDRFDVGVAELPLLVVTLKEQPVVVDALPSPGLGASRHLNDDVIQRGVQPEPEPTSGPRAITLKPPTVTQDVHRALVDLQSDGAELAFAPRLDGDQQGAGRYRTLHLYFAMFLGDIGDIVALRPPSRIAGVGFDVAPSPRGYRAGERDLTLRDFAHEPARMSWPVSDRRSTKSRSYLDAA